MDIEKFEKVKSAFEHLSNEMMECLKSVVNGRFLEIVELVEQNKLPEIEITMAFKVAMGLSKIEKKQFVGIEGLNQAQISRILNEPETSKIKAIRRVAFYKEVVKVMATFIETYDVIGNLEKKKANKLK